MSANRCCATIGVPKSSRRFGLTEHISRKELKHDKIRESIEHGAEAVYSHSRFTVTVVVAIMVIAAAYGGWSIYSERKNAEAGAGLDSAMKIYNARIRAGGEPVEPGEVTYGDEASRAQDAWQKFSGVADKYPRTNAGNLARYYSAICLEDLERHNQALEDLKKISAGGDKELAAMSQYQTAIIYARTGKSDEAVKLYRALAGENSVFVPKPLALLELAGVLRQNKPKEAATIYEQIKKDYPNTPVAEEADRGLDLLSPKS